jgi:hypothetical protein
MAGTPHRFDPLPILMTTQYLRAGDVSTIPLLSEKPRRPSVTIGRFRVERRGEISSFNNLHHGVSTR